MKYSQTHKSTPEVAYQLEHKFKKDYKDQLEWINSSYFACVICLLCFASNDEVIAEEHVAFYRLLYQQTAAVEASCT